jgi:hypothetical protein
VIRRTRILSGLCASLAIGGCGVVPGAVSHAQHATAFPDVNLSSRPCAVQTITLLTEAELPAKLTPQGPPSSEVGPRGLLDGATDGSVGRAYEYFQSTGASTLFGQATALGGIPYTTHRSEISQLAEGIDEYGTVATAERWMNGQRASNQPNNIPMFGDGVERIPSVPSLGDDTFMYQIDEGAPYNATPYLGAYVGHVYTNIEVRNGDLIFAVSIDSVAGDGAASLAISVARDLIAKEQSACG